MDINATQQKAHFTKRYLRLRLALFLFGRATAAGPSRALRFRDAQFMHQRLTKGHVGLCAALLLIVRLTVAGPSRAPRFRDAKFLHQRLSEGYVRLCAALTVAGSPRASRLCDSRVHIYSAL